MSGLASLFLAKRKPPRGPRRQPASDVHIEPKYVMVRYRIDGLLHDKIHIPLTMHQGP